MDGPQRRDINELLVNGYFKTSRAKSPSGATPISSNAPSFLKAADHDRPRHRSRSREPRRRGPPPPRPTVEDELVSLARESRASIPSYDPPLRGIPDQNPIILEADVSAAEAARLHAAPIPKDPANSPKNVDGNGERRFVFIPKTDTHLPTREDEQRGKSSKQTGSGSSKDRDKPILHDEQYRGQNKSSKQTGSGSSRDGERQRHGEEQFRESSKQAGSGSSRDGERQRHDEEQYRKNFKLTGSGSSKEGGSLKPEPTREKDTGRPPLERRRSRQDLPSLETKVPRDLPPQYRRSASAYGALPRDNDETPKANGPRTPGPEYFLSPDVLRGIPKEHFSSASIPRYASQDNPASSMAEKRSSRESSNAGSRPVTPSSDKRNSGNFETGGRSRRSSNEKMTRPQQLSEGHARRTERHHSARPDHHRHSRGSTQQNRHSYTSSDDDISNSDSDRHYSRRHHHSLRPDDEHLRSPSRSNRSSIERPLDRAGSRLNSPLPSPKGSPKQPPPVDQFERWEPHPRDPRIINSRPVSPLGHTLETPRASDRLNPMDSIPRPGSRQSNTVPSSNRTVPSAPLAAMPIPIPSRVDLYSPGETRRTPSIPVHDDNKTASTRSTSSSWQPPAFKPPSNNLEKPVGSVRRYSEDMERGAIVPLPTCPRTTFIRGHNDWLTLPQCSSFDICPSCFISTIAPTEFRDHFVQAPRRSANTEVLCDFGSSPWYRIAWLLTRKERRRDLRLFYGLANVATSAPPCLGKHEAVRQWHSIIDPKTRTPIQNFDVCYSCVKSIEVLLPPIRGVFVRTDNHHAPSGSGRVCDLRFDSKRFIQYFDALETTADRADDDDELPDTRSLASLVRRMASLEECELDKELFDARWHVITQLPDFTVCEECFEEIIWPEVEDKKSIPSMFQKTPQRFPRASCQLYSERMREIFARAVDGDDYKLLASKARERKTIEVAYRAQLENTKRQLKGNPTATAQEVERIKAEWKKWE